MGDFWNRSELANPPRHVEKKRKDAMYEWIPCAGSKRKLDLTEEERLWDEEAKPSAKLFAVDQTVQDYVLDTNGYMRQDDNPMCSPANNNTPAMDISQQQAKTDESAEMESMAVDECGDGDPPSSGLPQCMVDQDNDKNGCGITHGKIGESIGKCPPQFTSLILSHEVRHSMAKRPDDISTVLAQEMVKQATMAVVLWKPLLPTPSPLATVLPLSNSPNHALQNSNTLDSTTNFVTKEVKTKNGDEEDMETTEEI